MILHNLLMQVKLLQSLQFLNFLQEHFTIFLLILILN